MEKVPTYIKGLDDILLGGIPKERMVLLEGTSGAGKTIFGIEFLCKGAEKGEPGVFVACEESPIDLIENVKAFCDIEKLIKEDKIRVVDVSRRWITDVSDKTTEFGLGKVMEDIKKAVDSIGAKRVVIDPGSILLLQFENVVAIRKGLHNIRDAVRKMGCTSIFTTERLEKLSMTFCKDVEDFVLDGVITLNYDMEKGKRTLKVVKMRGSSFLGGKHEFRFNYNGSGITIFPEVSPELKVTSSEEKLSIGVRGIDDMLNGGAYIGDTTLVAGPTGSGKTILGLHFVHEGAKNGEKCLIAGFEESKEVLFRTANGIGFDFDKFEEMGLIKYVSFTIHDFIPARYKAMIKKEVEEGGIKRILIDSLSSYILAFETDAEERDHLLTLLSIFRANAATALMTYETHDMLGAVRITEAGLSFIVDNVILLRYVEISSGMEKAVSILKTRGSDHEKHIKQFDIKQGKGIIVGSVFRGLSGIMTGAPSMVAQKIEKFFD